MIGVGYKLITITQQPTPNTKKKKDMKVLMFGWEYPPHVFGGLATANYGISQGLHAQGDMDITL